jgi:DIS3-like exonuclease 2
MSSKNEKRKPCAAPGDQQQRGKRGKARPQKPAASYKGKKSKQALTKKLDKPFKPYINAEDVSHGLKRGDLIKSAIRINKKNFEQSFVANPDGSSDIFIPSLHARNRALEGDIVAVRLLPSALLENSLTDKCQAVASSDETGKAVAIGVGNMNISEISEVSDSVTRNDEVVQHSKDVLDATHLLQKLGEVVYIVEKKHSRVATGNLKAFDKSDQTAIFAPTDHRLPRIIIPLSECPAGYVKRPSDYTSTLFVGRITEWPVDSAFALGHLSRSIGEAGDIEPETEGFLVENGIDSEDFPAEVLDCLPKTLPWAIPEEELMRRRDLRSECVFTIDPATARDLDDALHCKQISEGVFEIGVHIADVSYFLRPKTALDRMAQSRATTVYLVQKVIPMLPRLLCEELCSLNPNEDRLAFSVIWSIDKKGNIIDEWFGRTVIRSCAKMAYAHAQQMIENPDGQWSEDELPDITDGHSIDKIIHCVQNLHKIAVHLKRNRFSEGALRLDQASCFPVLC